MREVEQVHGGESSEAGQARGAGLLVVLSEKLGTIARTNLWLRNELEGQRLIAVPKLRVEHVPAMMIAGGTGLGVVFGNIRLQTADWEEASGFVGGAWKMWRLGAPELHNVGFVLGEPTFNVEKAVRGITSMLK